MGSDFLTSKVGKRGAVVIPAPLRRRFGIEEGDLVIAEATEGGVRIRPAVAVPVEVYSPQRKARLLLENATDAADYARGRPPGARAGPGVPGRRVTGVVVEVDRLFLDGLFGVAATNLPPGPRMAWEADADRIVSWDPDLLDSGPPLLAAAVTPADLLREIEGQR